MSKTTVKTEVETKVAETKATETKAAETKAAKATKTTAKKAEKATETKEAKAEPKAAAKTAKTTKASTTKAASKKTEEIFLQFSGFEFSDSELVEKVKADYIAATGKKIFKSVKLYVKPEEMMVYYVVNEKYLGKVALS